MFTARIMTYSYFTEVKKDPGIPANFPYKEQILEEIKLTRQQVR